MGNGIAQVVAQSGYSVVMQDIAEEFVKKGIAAVDKSLSRFVKKGTVTEQEKTDILSRINTTTDLKEAKETDIVIEAIPEDLQIKIDAFKKLDDICGADYLCLEYQCASHKQHGSSYNKER